MNKAFEKILELIEQNTLHDRYSISFFNECGIKFVSAGKAKEIVQEVAEEYKGGWIPCSERLPEENQQVILQDFYGNITIEKLKITDGCVKGFSDGDWWTSANNYVAWQPLPEPYNNAN